MDLEKYLMMGVTQLWATFPGIGIGCHKHEVTLWGYSLYKLSTFQAKASVYNLKEHMNVLVFV